jgi:hypothetical protein
MWEYPIVRAFVDARLRRIGGTSVEVMKQIIARDMLPDNARRQGARDMTGPLHGITVLDLSSVILGPMAGQYLALQLHSLA